MCEVCCSQNSGLDTITVNVAKKELIPLRTLQTVSSAILGGREGMCGKFVVNPSERVQVVEVDRDGKSSIGYHGLGRCGCVWTCPTCSYKILSRRKDQISRILQNALAEDTTVGFLTLTIPHHRRQSAKELRKLVAGSWRKLRQRRAFRKMTGEIKVDPQQILLSSGRGRKKSYPKVILPDFEGDIRSLEITYGQNGFHPHLHILIFAKCSPAQMKVFCNGTFKIWAQIIKKAGYGECSEDAYDYQEVDSPEKVAEYVAKWDVAKEMTDAAGAKGGKGRNPSQILADIYQEKGNVKQDKAIYKEYAEAFKGSPKITINGKLKEKYLVLDWQIIQSFETEQMRQEALRKEIELVHDKKDQDIVYEKQKGKVIGEIHKKVWSGMIREGLREIVKDHIEAGGISEGVEVLNELGVPCDLEGNVIVPRKESSDKPLKKPPEKEIVIPKSGSLDSLLGFFSEIHNPKSDE